MSRRRIVLLVLIGAVAGAWVGLGYLDDGGRCAASLTESEVACRINHAWVPFIGTVVVGMLAAFAINALISRLSGLQPSQILHRPAVDGTRHDLGEELSEVELRATELGLDRSTPESSEPARVRIGERGPPVPQQRRSSERRRWTARGDSAG